MKMKYIGFSLGGLTLLSLILSFYTIDQGERGVVLSYGEFK